MGPIAVSKSPPDLAAMEKAFAKVKQGGIGVPEDCVARYRVAIVIPFRDRFPHLMTLLYNLHPLLLRQQLDYQIFVIEQEGELSLLALFFLWVEWMYMREFFSPVVYSESILCCRDWRL